MSAQEATGRRVVVTGLGAISCLGSGVPAFWEGLTSGGGTPRPVTDPDARMANRLMYLVPAADVPDGPERHAHVELAAGPRMAIAAAHEAVADAGLDDAQRERLSVVLGVEMGNAGRHEARRAAEHGAPIRRAVGRWSPMTVTSAAVSAAIGATGGSTSVGNACAASGYAAAIAADMIRAGEAEMVLTGGAEGPTRVGMGVFNRIGAADPVACRPFDTDRQGTLFGDGAAMLVLESAEHAEARGATVYAELSAAAFSCDAHHPTAPDPGGTQAVRGMRRALADAGLRPADVGGVVPHGTGTPLNDVVESEALREVFGELCDELPLFSLKAMIGHTAGVAGAFGVLTAALMLHHGRVPANAPVTAQDPRCAVWLPQDRPVPLSASAVLVNAYAFGGNNVSLVLTGVPGAGSEREHQGKAGWAATPRNDPLHQDTGTRGAAA
ncbi:beta-ketoacyl-[acyl-carrier-protein] synthase family protein [Streptomyces sp. NBC_01724]|uniref:beta-ketoacyl-[acyl-carrier-protein] synthase family protein n=1 Tax=unclassified Streptomyces TaxID=2593676 RepID=UPI002E2FB1DD|nr:beta-ketoacyl-[acyl-carrier-protein] synthase family protein [Streptomyces sp. NBC_01724]WTE54600.1 beta-ketoacyl-[acyl-carrier-protein] synthase family protein [Streptomyces sp. NBC_01620]